jgi:phosphomannomutase
MTALMAKYFLDKEPKSTIVYDLRSSLVVAEEVLKNGGTPRRERVGHAFMKKALRDSHAVFGGELSGHFYYRDNYYADSGLITLVHVLNIVSDAKVPVSELIRPLRRYSSSGEINFEVEDKPAKMDELARVYNDGKIDQLDGVTIWYKDWWFNCRPSNTEPLLRLNVEAKSKKLLDEKLAEIEQRLGKPFKEKKQAKKPKPIKEAKAAKEKKVTKKKKAAKRKKVTKKKKAAKKKKTAKKSKTTKKKKTPRKKK